MVILFIALFCISATTLSSSVDQLIGKENASDVYNSTANNTANSNTNNTENGTTNINPNGAANITLLSLDQFAEDHPIDPEVGILLSQVAAGKNATVNFGQVLPGAGQKLHYHEWHDEIVYVIRGTGFMTIAGQNRSIEASDLIYVPSKVVHNNSASGNETMEAITIYVPAFDGKDKIFV
jgi:mannose-6-phosphate isomerase-like protein (cupin superfamily)